MNQQFTAEDILNAKQIYFYNNETLYIIDHDDEAYGYSKGCSGWYHKENFWDYFESELMMTYFTHITKEEAVQLYLGWADDYNADNCRLDKAIIFAVEHHAGQFRKSTVLPYITHPIETMQILYSMRADINLLIAGVLHDTIEDTEATEQDIRELFGDDVAGLVTAHSEDKSKTWQERKTHAIEELAKADKRLKMLIMADKVSNLRNMVSDYSLVGDELWNRFNAPVNKQSRYYSDIQDALCDMQKYPECAAVYWEMVGLYKDLFVRYYLDKRTNTLYRFCLGIAIYALQKGTPQWTEYQEKHIPENAEPIERLAAEHMEDDWKSAFQHQHEMDISNASYSVYGSIRRCIDFRISDGKLTVACEDFGPECQNMTGNNMYEFFYQLDEDNTLRLLTGLRIEYGLETDLIDLLKEAFGSDDGTTLFTNFCKKNRIKYKFFSM
ncbi:MAG: bifunctional (p)ppGpp synthetase/guanosine-3',5'-bis(diphosphate) 3'-pyrophosphohydrolase [Firmicutes bacterium]|nr:bifunctional (p)ppGpp synthetase/guanosine-3',5'-bis(diphosphate) 3'-pyrophosphohydrolase [Bacillota bacterium]